jgi:hypothetical protein
MDMLMKCSATLIASSHELGRASGLLGIHIDLTGFFPEPFGTVLQTCIIITHSLPSAHSDLLLQRPGCFELSVFADCVELM